MRYEIGKMFECEIEQSKPLTPIDYVFPTEKENQKYINLIATDTLRDFEIAVIIKRRKRIAYEDYFKRNSTKQKKQ